MIKAGTRLRSQVCETQIIVVKATDSLENLSAGGLPMLPLDAAIPAGATPDPTLASGNLMGKRYVDDTGAEVLVTKAGVGTLTVGDIPLTLKEVKPLPASD
ncbi:hypothetical protein ACRU13_09385 [Mycobacterium colombiense]